jgi:DNA-binding transcriptional MerR regulator
MSSPTFSFKDWYADNGGRLNKSRRNRYKDDPEYRARVLELNRKSRELRREDQAEVRAAATAARELNLRLKPWKTVEASVNGSSAKLRTIGALAKTLGISVQAVRIWEREGTLPPAPLRNKKGDRLYTEEYIELATSIIEQQGRMPDGDKPFEPPEVKAFTATVRRGRKDIEVVVFRIGTLARSMRRTVVTLEQMESRGVLPETPFRAAKTRYRLYTEDMMAAVREALSARGGSIRGADNWREFHDEVMAAWKKQGVFEVKLVKLEPIVAIKPKAPSL